MNKYYRLEDGVFVKSDVRSKKSDEYLVSMDNVNKLLSGLTSKVVDTSWTGSDEPKVIVSKDSGFRINLEVLDNLNVVKHVSLR